MQAFVSGLQRLVNIPNTLFLKSHWNQSLSFCPKYLFFFFFDETGLITQKWLSSKQFQLVPNTCKPPAAAGHHCTARGSCCQPCPELIHSFVLHAARGVSLQQSRCCSFRKATEWVSSPPGSQQSWLYLGGCPRETSDCLIVKSKTTKKKKKESIDVQQI